MDKKVENLRKLLLIFFKHIVGYFETLDSFNDELSLLGLNRMEHLYFVGSVTGRLSKEFGKHHYKIDYVFNFLRWYVQGVLKWYELLSNLIRALGCIDWFSVYREEIKIEDVVDPESVDPALLALNVRSAVEFTLPELKNALLNVAREAKSIPRWVAFFLSEKVLEFIRLSGEIAESWLKIQEDILNRLEDTRLDPAERIVDIIKIMVTFKEELKRVDDIFALEERILKSASLEDLDKALKYQIQFCGEIVVSVTDNSLMLNGERKGRKVKSEITLLPEQDTVHNGVISSKINKIFIGTIEKTLRIADSVHLYMKERSPLIFQFRLKDGMGKVKYFVSPILKEGVGT